MEDDGDVMDDSKRRTRNLSEKKRRDQFNMLVNELSTMISSNNRKMDKSTILKSTISFLRNHNDITVRSRAHDVKEDWKPTFLSNEEFTYLLLEALEGFLMVFSATGRIYYVSDSITTLLGHKPADIVNRSIFDLAHEDDRFHLYGLLQSVDPSQGLVKDNEVRFQCHLRRGVQDFQDDNSYEQIQFFGHFRSSMDTTDDDNQSYQTDQDLRLLFVCAGRLETPHLIRDVSLVDSSRSEFTSRHSLEWKFLFLDHRAPPIIGYLPFEVLGTSGYDYYHFDDLENVVTCHEALMQKGELTSCYYRFLTKGQQWIWLQTRFFITYHQWNSKPEFVVCTHRVVSYDDVKDTMKLESGETDNMSEADSARCTTTDASDRTTARRSPSCMSEMSDAFGPYQAMSQPSSIKSACGSATVPHSWHSSQHRAHGSSDTASFSGESKDSHRNSTREALKDESAAVVPQHSVGAQYLQPPPYIGMANVLPLPVLLPQDESRLQEHLQRKHEELHQMIVRQQAELRQVKEQLLLARLGILSPLDAAQATYVNEEGAQQGGNQLAYEAAEARPSLMEYPPPQPSNTHSSNPHSPQ